MKEEQTNLKVATLAGGCFWCLASDLEKVSGVAKVIPGYTGGQKENPTYEEVTTGKTGHYEAVQVYYDPSKVSYEQILGVFWRHIDPTDPGGQFVDRGPQYSTAIFYHDDEQKRIAEKSKAGFISQSRKVRTQVFGSCLFVFELNNAGVRFASRNDC